MTFYGRVLPLFLQREAKIKIKNARTHWILSLEVIMERVSESCSVMSDSLWPHGLYSPWNSPGQNTGIGSLSLLQGIFSTQGLNPGPPHCRCILFFFFLFIYLFCFICGGFCHTLKWNSQGFTCVPHPNPPSHLPLHPIPLSHERSPCGNGKRKA